AEAGEDAGRVEPEVLEDREKGQQPDEDLERAPGKRDRGDGADAATRHRTCDRDTGGGIDQPQDEPRESDRQERLGDARDDAVRPDREPDRVDAREEDRGTERQTERTDDEVRHYVVDVRAGPACDRAHEAEERGGE